jgi:hypothetical protein
VLRGLHYQIEQAQGKLVRVTAGEVYDVAVDLRRSSPTFGQWVGFTLSAADKRMAWIPPGFAHGFCVTSESAEFLYKTTDYWSPAHERTLLWNDPHWRFPGHCPASRCWHRQGQVTGTPLASGRNLRMKILLTGCAGQLGRELKRSLACLGELVACDRPPA